MTDPPRADGAGAAPAPSFTRPRIRKLSTRQAAYVLTRNHVGRIAFVNDGRPAILPVHYVYAGDDIVGRTSYGMKAAAWDARPEVAFEVDETDAIFQWRSVIVQGTIGILSAHGTREERLLYWNAVSAIRTLVPDAMSERDPTPERQIVFAIEPREISGREVSVRH